jgi:hypothetical protein
MPNPNRNQKTVPKEEKEKMDQGAKLRKEKDDNDLMTLKRAERELFEKEKENLPVLLESRLQAIETALATELDDITGLTEPRIHQLIARNANGLVGYSAKELMIVFEAYRDLIVKINEKVLFAPTMKNFCAFAGFSTHTFKNYLQSPDEEKRNVAQMVEDYISDMSLAGAKMRRFEPASTIYELKSVHGQAEAVNPQFVNLGNQVNVNSILERIAQIKSGKVIEADFKEKK